MSFKASLFALINAASSFSVDGYSGEEFSYSETRRRDPKDSVRYCEIDSDEHDLEAPLRFLDQVVSVNDVGFCKALCREGDSHNLQFLISRPITEGDLT